MLRRTINSAILVVILLFLFLQHSCKIKEKIITQEHEVIEEFSELVKRINQTNKDIKVLKYKNTRIDITLNDQNWTINGTIGIIKDSIIVLSLVPAFGYEIARAEMLGKRIVCLYSNSSENHLSAMISGNTNLLVLRYDKPEALKTLMKEMIA